MLRWPQIVGGDCACLTGHESRDAGRIRSGDAMIGRRWYQLALVLVVLSSTTTASCAGSVASSPETAARVWMRTFMDGDSKRLSKLTCDEQLAIPNLIATGQLTGDALLAAFETLGLAPADWKFSIGALRDKIAIDLEELQFERLSAGGEDDAIVNIRGRIGASVGQAYFTKAVDSRWMMIRAKRNWQWCGLGP